VPGIILLVAVRSGLLGSVDRSELCLRDLSRLADLKDGTNDLTFDDGGERLF